MVYKYGCNTMRKGSSVCHILVFSSQPTQRAVCVCAEELSSSSTLEQGERERKVSKLLTWSLVAGTNKIGHPIKKYTEYEVVDTGVRKNKLCSY